MSDGDGWHTIELEYRDTVNARVDGEAVDSEKSLKEILEEAEE